MAVILEVAALELVVIGILRQVGPIPPALASIAEWIMAGTWTLALAALLLVEWRAYRSGR